jgi:hypothetical protein
MKNFKEAMIVWTKSKQEAKQNKKNRVIAPEKILLIIYIILN